MQVTDILELFKLFISHTYFPIQPDFRLIGPLCGLLLFFAASCGDLSEEDKQQIQQALSDSLLMSTESWDVEMTLIKDGYRNVKISGSRAKKYHFKQRPYTEIFGPVSVVVYDSLQNITTYVTCKRAIYHDSQQLFEFFENVAVRTEDGFRLKTGFLQWYENNNRIYSPEFVTITTPTDSIAGVGFESDTKFQNYVIRQSSGEVIVND